MKYIGPPYAIISNTLDYVKTSLLLHQNLEVAEQIATDSGRSSAEQ
jgi:hypothetical protein